jgi:ABC-type transport system involved in multi-copper enzyme maturation permease subunit
MTDAPKWNAGFQRVWLIAMKEFRSHLLTEKYLWTTLLCVGMLIVSFWLTAFDYQERLTNHSLSLRKKDVLYGSGMWWYTYRPGWRIGKPAYFRPTPIIKKPNVMSIFVQGLERRISRPAYSSLHKELDFDDVSHTNLLTDMYAIPDLMYIVQIAMSLLALLFTFQSVCGERERGTLKLMLANPVPRHVILLGKWLGGYLCLALPFLLALGIGVLALSLMPSVSLSAEHWIRLGWLLLASLLYISVFFALGLLISTLTKRAITSFLVALFAWVILVLVLPNIGTLLAREIEPVESRQQFQVRKELMKRQMEDEREKTQHSAYWVHTYGQMHLEIWDDVQEATRRLDTEHQQQTQRLADYTRILTRLSPAAAYAYAAMDIAGTNISDEFAYYGQLRRFIRDQPEEEHQFVERILWRHQTWDFQYFPPSWQEGVTRALADLFLLALLNVIIFVFAHILLIRYQVK